MIKYLIYDFCGNCRSLFSGTSEQQSLEQLVLLFLDLGRLGFSMDCNLAPSIGQSPIYVLTLTIDA